MEQVRSLEGATAIHTHQEKAELKESATLDRSTKDPRPRGIPLPPTPGETEGQRQRITTYRHRREETTPQCRHV